MVQDATPGLADVVQRFAVGDAEQFLQLGQLDPIIWIVPRRERILELTAVRAVKCRPDVAEGELPDRGGGRRRNDVVAVFQAGCLCHRPRER